MTGVHLLFTGLTFGFLIGYLVFERPAWATSLKLKLWAWAKKRYTT